MICEVLIMQNEHSVSPNSTFCRGCSGKSEIKVMCPMIDIPTAGYTCVSLFHCKRCMYYKDVDLEICRVDCLYGK